MYTGHQDAEWRPFLQAIHSKLTDQAFETWFRPLRFQRSVQEGVLRIAAPNDVVRDWILSKYAEPLRQSLNESHLGSLRIEWQISSHNSKPSEVAEPLPRESDRVPLQSAESALPEVGLSDVSRLNAKYTFSDFVVASCNRLAHAAAMAVADAPGQTYNPLYLYGGVGLGKTHLVQAAGHAIKTVRPDLPIA